jgi:hypothetical protein
MTRPVVAHLDKPEMTIDKKQITNPPAGRAGNIQITNSLNSNMFHLVDDFAF